MQALANAGELEIGKLRQGGKVPPHYKSEELLTLRDELRAVWGGPLHTIVEDGDEDGESGLAALDLRSERLNKVLEIQDCKYPDEPIAEVICRDWLERDDRSPKLVLTWASKGIGPNGQCLPVALAYGCLSNYRLLRFCRRQGCPHPFFIGSRSDQKYCCSDCAQVKKRESKRSWWRDNRANRPST
jgi:hypothetical protein